MTDIGERIKQIRKEAKLSQHDFAQSIEVSQGFLSNIEKGRHQATVELLIRITNTYEVDANWLLSGKNKAEYESLPEEHQILIHTYDAASDESKENALIILKNSAAKSKASELKEAK